MIRILLCDDQPVTLEGLKTILSTNADIDVVGTATNGADALALIPQVDPDLILMDLKMPGMNGIQATRQSRQHYPHIPVLVLTTYDGDEWVFDAIRAGASGYLLKDAPHEELVAAIRGTISGLTYVDPAIAGKLFDHVTQHAPTEEIERFAVLNEREITILRMLAKGMTNKGIARHLHLSDGTVRNYISAICTKLGVNDRTQAALIASRHWSQ